MCHKLYKTFTCSCTHLLFTTPCNNHNPHPITASSAPADYCCIDCLNVDLNINPSASSSFEYKYTRCFSNFTCGCTRLSSFVRHPKVECVGTKEGKNEIVRSSDVSVPCSECFRGEMEEMAKMFDRIERDVEGRGE
ncbi:uncharacterized protein RAG0_16052 [Rhynchosporium agropyri]|uniref:Uncharacterized protein n=1 Tax=Rhynchosporium agropyri TaxID=914238 RepID=A0A1E1LNK8_9HELO|nr:uncharacterized protein RAG0_16052 [Rhynchosporium agropyri]